jgi:hypothetical protein
MDWGGDEYFDGGIMREEERLVLVVWVSEQWDMDVAWV